MRRKYIVIATDRETDNRTVYRGLACGGHGWQDKRWLARTYSSHKAAVEVMRDKNAEYQSTGDLRFIDIAVVEF